LANRLLTNYDNNSLSSSWRMGRAYLDEFEGSVLLTVAYLQGKAYGAGITQSIKQRTGRAVVLSAVPVTLYRLKEKELVTSFLGEAPQGRGGRRKRLLISQNIQPSSQ
jgi:PadR family transcriptional regulator, regulatory protein PadR